MSKTSKAQILAQEYGHESAEEMALEYIMDSTVPAICKNMHCNAIFDMEPDQDKGWCEECGENTVEGLYILIGMM